MKKLVYKKKPNKCVNSKKEKKKETEEYPGYPEPCGTPAFTAFQLEVAPGRTSRCFMLASGM